MIIRDPLHICNAGFYQVRSVNGSANDPSVRSDSDDLSTPTDNSRHAQIMQRVRSMPNAPAWLRNTTSEDLANPSVRLDSDQNSVLVLDAQNDHLISLTSNTDLHQANGSTIRSSNISANGSVNGSANESANGSANGSANESANGSANESANGSANGFVPPTDYRRWVGIVQRVRSMPNAPAWMKEKAEDLNNAAEYLANSSERSDSYNLIRFIRSIPNPHAWVNSTAENLNNAADLIDNPSAGANSELI